MQIIRAVLLLSLFTIIPGSLRAEPPQVRLVPSTMSGEVGEAIEFDVIASANARLTQLGLELCNASGTPTANLGYLEVADENVGYKFSWVPPATGTYYFDGYAWDSGFVNLTRTAIVVIDIGPATPQVTVAPNRMSASPGDSIIFTVDVTCTSGLNEIGLELCDQSGVPTTNLGLSPVSGTSAQRTYSWTAPAVGSYWFGGYGWNTDRSKLTRTPPVLVEVNPSATPVVSLIPTPRLARPGETVSFELAAACTTGLGQVGLESCSSTGTVTGNLGFLSVSGNNTQQSFPWSSSTEGLFFFDGYAWNSNFSQLTRTQLPPIQVRVASDVPRSFLSASSLATVGYGQSVVFTVNANCDHWGLNEIGIEKANASGTAVSNLLLVPAAGYYSKTNTYTWVAPSQSGKHYFNSYAWNASRTRLHRSQLVEIEVVSNPPADPSAPIVTIRAPEVVLDYRFLGMSPVFSQADAKSGRQIVEHWIIVTRKKIPVMNTAAEMLKNNSYSINQQGNPQSGVPGLAQPPYESVIGGWAFWTRGPGKYKVQARAKDSAGVWGYSEVDFVVVR